MLAVDNKKIFGLIIESALKVKGFSTNQKIVDLIEIAFIDCFKKDGKIRKSGRVWTGYVTDNGIDEKARDQCLKAAFWKVLNFHIGRAGNGVGTLMNASFQLRLLADSYGFTKEEQKEFDDACDTFCQVFVYLASKCKVSSVPGSEWRRALGYTD
jgi:hypothetical protein